jgi:RNA polymerase sigma-70 factor (sigma-E family)
MDRQLRDEQFRDFVVGRRARLCRLAYLLCGDAHLAEDIVQVALTKLYVAWPRLRHDGNVDAFARRIVVRAHLDQVKKPSRREHATDDLGDAAARTGLPVEDRDALMAALLQLPAGQRRVVVLRYYWQLDVEETAADLGCSTGTVKSQSARALARLEQSLSSVFHETKR